jgi:hypothetical protein
MTGERWFCIGRLGYGWHVVSADNQQIAVFYGGDTNPDGEAAARLGAAAPMLRDALTALLPHVKVTKATRAAIIDAAFALNTAGSAVE